MSPDPSPNSSQRRHQGTPSDQSADLPLGTQSKTPSGARSKRLDFKAARQYITRPILLIFCVIAGCLGIILFTWSSLHDIEKALPITIAQQQRDIALLVQDVSDLAWQAKLANSDPSPQRSQKILEQVSQVEKRLSHMRKTYNFDNLVGASAMHSVISPALADIRRWLTSGIYNQPADSPVVIALVETRTTDAINTMRPMFAMTQQNTFNILRTQSGQILTFRNSIVFFLIGVLLITVVVIFQMYKLKKIDQALFEAREAAEKASKAKSEFLATMSHEFRTPLNAILGFSEMMRDQFFGPLGANKIGAEKYTEYTHDIHHSGQHLLSLVNDVLDIAAIEAGKRSLISVQINTRDLIEDCIKSIEKRARDNHVALLTDIPKGIPMLYADKRAVTQILLNLLSNAIKFTDENGQIQVTASSENKQVKITVKDTGIGISADRLPTITDAFSQGDTNPHRAKEGTGLGLSIAKALIEAHEGSLEVKSQLGAGTEVSITLPCWGATKT